MENTHRWVALQLTRDVHLRRILPFAVFHNFRQHQFRCCAGVLFDTALEERGPLVLFAQMLITHLQHFQRFADQFFILVDDTQKALYRFSVFPFCHKHASHHDRHARAIAVGGRSFFQQGHRLIHIVIPHLL